MTLIALTAFKDNYIWVGQSDESNDVFVVDPGDALPVLKFLAENQLNLKTILITHKHADHTDGIPLLRDRFPDVAIYAHPAENLSHVTHPVTDGDVFHLTHWPTPFHVFHIPGHTLGHVAFYAQPALFCGDTLFSAGCGRVFEGTMPQMHHSLEKLAALPEDTLIYCGHEYTLANLQFASLVEPKNTDITDRIHFVKNLRDHHQPSLPSTLSIEKRTNPFLRTQSNAIITSAEKHANRPLATPTEVFAELRLWKNSV